MEGLVVNFMEFAGFASVSWILGSGAQRSKDDGVALAIVIDTLGAALL